MKMLERLMAKQQAAAIEASVKEEIATKRGANQLVLDNDADCPLCLKAMVDKKNSTNKWVRTCLPCRISFPGRDPNLAVTAGPVEDALENKPLVNEYEEEIEQHKKIQEDKAEEIKNTPPNTMLDQKGQPVPVEEPTIINEEDLP